MNTQKYIAYYRVSTNKQGVSGLGLEAQKQSVYGMVGKANIISEFTEVESGANDEREILGKALMECSKAGAKLVIAKLDRLSRDLEFICKLMKSGAEFMCCDLPNANSFTLHIFAAFAEHERQMISERTKKGLQSLKEREGKVHYKKGTNLDNIKKANEAVHLKAMKNENNTRAAVFAKEAREKGINFTDIMNELNRLGFKTSKGFEFTNIIQVKRLLNFRF